MKSLKICIFFLTGIALAFFAGFFYYEDVNGFKWKEQDNENIMLVKDLLLKVKNSKNFTDKDAQKFFGRHLESPKIYKDDAQYMFKLKEVLGRYLESDTNEYIFSCGISKASNSIEEKLSERAYDFRVVCVIEDISSDFSSNKRGINFIVFSVEPYNRLIRTNIYINGKSIWNVE